MDACPPLEDIAAFIDGMLSPAERERMTAHLARCESCYEVFAGVVEFQEESSAEDTTGRGVLPFPLVEPAAPDPAPAVPLARRKTRWFPLAASIVLTAGVGFFAWQASRPPEITLAGVVDTVEDRSAAAERLYVGNVYRNAPPPSPSDAAEFMTGVYLLDLRLSGTSEKSPEILKRLAGELKDSSMTQDLVERYWDESLDFREPEEAGRQILENEIQERLHEIPSFSFGLWAEAGRLAAATNSPEFFEDRDNRRFLSQIQKELPVPDDLHEQVLGDLQTIESHWGKDLSALQTSFGRIIEAIDGYDEYFPEEPPL